MEERVPFAVGVVETDFFNGVELTVPDKPFGVDFAAEAVKGKADGNRFG